MALRLYTFFVHVASGMKGLNSSDNSGVLET